MKVTAYGHYSRLGVVDGSLSAIGDRKLTDKEAKEIFEKFAAELLGEEVFHLHTECKCSALDVDGKYINDCKCFAYVDVASSGAPPSKEYEI